MELLEMMEHRRSVRTYTGEPIPEESLQKILQAGLLSPSGRNIRPWELIVVRDKDTLQKISRCREHGPGMIPGADAAIVVVADPTVQDVWTEDCSIVMAYMHLMADALGVGSVWVQGRLRQAPDGRLTEEYLRDLLGYPENYKLEAILSLGMPAMHPGEKSAADVPMEKVHFEKY